jgi:hypothetical protein
MEMGVTPEWAYVMFLPSYRSSEFVRARLWGGFYTEQSIWRYS